MSTQQCSVNVTTITVGYTAQLSDRVIICNNVGAITLNLYTAIGNKGQFLYIKKTTATEFPGPIVAMVTITPFGAELIEGVATFNLFALDQGVLLVSDGIGWKRILDTGTFFDELYGGHTEIEGILVLRPAVQIITAATDTILPVAAHVRLNNTSGGPLTLTSVPTIANGAVDGQLLMLSLTAMSMRITIQDRMSLVGSNVRTGLDVATGLFSSFRELSVGDTMLLQYNNDLAAGTRWCEVSFAEVS